MKTDFPIPSTTSLPETGSVATALHDKLSAGLDAERLEVRNESDQHSGPPGRESHFRILVVSRDFTGKNRLARHRTIHALVREQLEGSQGAPGIHALAIDAMTPEEWAARGGGHESPACLGGSKND